MDEGGESRFYDRVCEALCRLTSIERAGLLLYDRARYVARAVGSHGVDRTLIGQLEANLDEAPMARRALSEDRVVEVSGRLEEEIPPRYARFAGITTLTCAPVAAGGSWYGVIVADQGGGHFSLQPDEAQTMLTLGRLAALAAMVERSTRQHEKARRLDERIELIREVHDQVIQRLFGLSLALGAEQPLTPEERARCSQELRTVLTQLRTALGRPLAPREPDSATTLRRYLRHRAEVSAIDVAWSEGAEVPMRAESLAQSVVVEALRNADRHAPGGHSQVNVSCTDEAFVLEVINDGVAPGLRGAGLGLRILTLEALRQNGLLEFGPLAGDAWRVRLIVPIDSDD
jgi:signal transduction histidine kinase